MSKRKLIALLSITVVLACVGGFLYFAITAPTVSNVVSSVEDASDMKEVGACRDTLRLHVSPARSDDELRILLTENSGDIVWLGDDHAFGDDSTVLMIPAFATLWDRVTGDWPVSVVVLGDANGAVLGYLVK